MYGACAYGCCSVSRRRHTERVRDERMREEGAAALLFPSRRWDDREGATRTRHPDRRRRKREPERCPLIRSSFPSSPERRKSGARARALLSRDGGGRGAEKFVLLIEDDESATVVRRRVHGENRWWIIFRASRLRVRVHGSHWMIPGPISRERGPEQGGRRTYSSRRRRCALDSARATYREGEIVVPTRSQILLYR